MRTGLLKPPLHRCTASIPRNRSLVGNDGQPSRGTIHNFRIVAAWVGAVVKNVAWLPWNVVSGTPSRVPVMGIVEPRRGKQRGADENERVAAKPETGMMREMIREAGLSPRRTVVPRMTAEVIGDMAAV